ncbi:homoaconitase [Exidia glandulosa HHB12029]|uniref:Homoaconitase, mitochondrial n=1 Tax=Exidia glandulosa HHB12029 TaxID=1314781 RepID=A0A165QIP5_EXIGL|nr:homoaconitase [Exidia glandulosa HHB12029]
MSLLARLHLARCPQRRTLATATSVPQTLIEKIVQKYAVDLAPGKVVRAGDYVMLRPHKVMTHDNTAAVLQKFTSLGVKRIHDPRQVVFTIDHDVQNKSDKNLAKYATIERLARTHDVDFYPSGRGIGHQILIEEGYAFPYTLTVASDSHSNMYGGVGCVGTPIVRTDAAAIWATGQTWWLVPRIVNVELKGKLAPGCSGKDVIVALCGYFNKDDVLNAAIEFTGDGVQSLTVDDRLTISNMTTEWGALAGVFPVDNTLLNWYDALAAKIEKKSFGIPHPRVNKDAVDRVRRTRIVPDAGAYYYSHLVFDLSTLIPHVSGPNSVKVATPLPELEEKRIEIQKAYLLSCTNARAADIAAAADVLRGKRIAQGVDFYVAAASSIVQAETEESGHWADLLAAGARPLPPGCGPCIGLGTGLLEEGQTGISATNRNYKGRMGHPAALAYLASPAVVAASALKGYICAPEGAPASSLSTSSPTFRTLDTPSQAPAASTSSSASEELYAGFPPVFGGELLFTPQDNLNTDGIYPGKYTYQDDITRERQAEIVMENYDPSFASITTSLREQGRGSVLVAGRNFGTGSSREQAATALKAAGVQVVLAASFGDIFRRNAVNNALVCVEAPELVELLTARFAKDGKRNAGGKDGELTVRPGWTVEVDMRNGRVAVQPEGVEFWVTPVGRSVQELWTCGGLEGYILKKIDGEATASA